MSETARGSIENDIDRTVGVEEASALKLNFCLGGQRMFRIDSRVLVFEVLFACALTLVGPGAPLLGQTPAPPASPRPDATRNIRREAFEPVSTTAPAGNSGIFVGVNEFSVDKRVGRLNFAVHDAIELAHLFVFELGLLPARNCHVLLSGKPSHPRVTAHLQSLAEAGAKVATADRSQVLLQLEQVCGVSQKSTDLLVCAVSSHGFTAGGSAYFLPADGVRTKLSQTGVSLNEFETEMERSKAGHRLLLVDACQERVQTKSVGVPEAWQITDKAFKAAFDRPTGQYKFASCSVQELSYESGELGNVGHGVFSHAVLEALRGGAPADDEHLIRLTAVEKYVSAYVTNWTRESRRPAQTPYRGGSIASGSLPLARKSSDLKTLANTVKAMPRTANFTAELQRGLLARLERADPASDRDRELVRLTRQYAQGAVPEVAFAAYLEKELAIRPSLESMAMRLSFLVRDGAGEQGPPLAGATVMVTGRTQADAPMTSIGAATTDERGGAVVIVPASRIAPSGEYYVRVVKEQREKTWRLTDVAAGRVWHLSLSVLPKAGDVFTSRKGMKLSYIPPGGFVMGSNDTEEDLEEAGIPVLPDYDLDEEGPRRNVRFARGLYFGKYEITRGQFAEFVRSTGHKTTAERHPEGGWGYDAQRNDHRRDPKFNWRWCGWEQTDGHPVVNVSWLDVVAYCNWLSRAEGLTECYRINGNQVTLVSTAGYRLPTEAEFEYACRAGTTTRFYTGDLPGSLEGYENVADRSGKRNFQPFQLPEGLDPAVNALIESLTQQAHPHFEYDDRWRNTSPVGEFRPNRWGLYDMLGNVHEWCGDWFDEDYYEDGHGVDPQGPSEGALRVIRGGSFLMSPIDCRCANRLRLAPDQQFLDVGFRVVCGTAPEEK